MTSADPQEAQIRSIAQDLKRLAELEELLMRQHAERLGIHVTDVRCLVALAEVSPSTAGKLAELLALSTGAVTAMLDRLERAGLVTRHKSPEDRRQVLVRLSDDAGERARDAADVWLRTAHRALDDVEPVDVMRLRAVLDALIFGFSEEIERVRGVEASDGVREGLLRITHGGQKIVVDGAAPADELFVVRDGRGAIVGGGAGAITVRNGTVTVGGPLTRRGEALSLSLSPALRWRIEVRGSAMLLACRLQEIDVRSVEIVGGAHEITLHLGMPHVAVPVRLVGGASHLTVYRPRAAAARVVVRDGMSGASLDGVPVGVGDASTVVSAGFSAVAPHYDVEIKGGASHATVDIT